jgi:uncharacterized membrane protein YgcG
MMTKDNLTARTSSGASRAGKGTLEYSHQRRALTFASRLAAVLLVMLCMVFAGASACLADNTYTTNSGESVTIPTIDDTSASVYDYAGLFSDDEKEVLESEAQDLESSKDCDIIILTADNIPADAEDSSKTTEQYAQQFYIDNWLSADGSDDSANAMIFVIDMSNRWILATGHGKYASEKYADWEDKTENAVYTYASDGDYYGCADAFLARFKKLDNPVYALVPTGGSIAASAVITVLVLLIIVLVHSKSQPSKATTPPVRETKYTPLRHDKHFLGTTVTSHRIPKDTGNGGGGGGHVSSGGGFSGGGGSFSSGGGHRF